MNGKDRVAVTGIGVVSPAGIGIDSLRAALESGRSCIDVLPDHIGAHLRMRTGGLVPEAEGAFAITRAALEEALCAAALPAGSSAALHLGSALGGIEWFEPTEDAAVAPPLLPHDLTIELARCSGLDVGTTFTATCASALYALEQACAELALGRRDAVVCGGFDTLSRFMQSGFHALGALHDDGTGDGLILGEAACFVVLEPLGRARARGARVRCVLAGRGNVADAAHLTAPDPTGRGMVDAITRCLADADLRPEDVTHFSQTADASHRYRTMYGAVLEEVFGAQCPELVGWERSVGHVMAATGVFGLAHAALVLERDRSARAVLSMTVGFGGQNSAHIACRDNDRPAPATPSEPRGVALRAVAVARPSDVPDDFEDWFPGRWNRRRAMWDGARVLAFAQAEALEGCGWWRRGHGETVRGGLIVGADVHAIGPASRFARQLERAAAAGQAVQRATEFLFALPSSVAALCGMAFGLEEQQTTMLMHGSSGVAALAFSHDLIAAGRADRLVVGALTSIDADGAAAAHEFGLELGPDAVSAPDLAVVWCLEAVASPDDASESPLLLGAGSAGRPEPATDSNSLLPDLPPSLRGLAAPSLLAASRLMDRRADGATVCLLHRDPRTGSDSWVRLRNGGSV